MRKELDRKFVKSLAILGVSLIVSGVSLSDPEFVDTNNQDWRTLAFYTKFAQIGFTKNLSGRDDDTVLFFNFLGRKFNVSFSG